MHSYDQSDPTFIQDLLKSQQYVWLTAKILSGRGYDVTVPAPNIRPDASQMAEYADNGDLKITLNVEVKQRPELNFTSKSDFPYDTVIVDVCHTFDKAKIKPFFYIIYNAKATHAIIVMGNTHKKWKKIEKYDRPKNRTRSFYECPIELCSFTKI